MPELPGVVKMIGGILWVLLGGAALAQGLVAFLWPRRCIEIFQAWCRFLNWDVKPIDWTRELRNTRILGGLLFILGLLLLLLFYTQLKT